MKDMHSNTLNYTQGHWRTPKCIHGHSRARKDTQGSSEYPRQLSVVNLASTDSTAFATMCITHAHTVWRASWEGSGCLTDYFFCNSKLYPTLYRHSIP